MSIQDLMKKRNEAWNAAKSFVENHKNANGLMSKEDMETYDKMEQEIHDYTKEIERMQREMEIENNLSKATSTPLVEKPVNVEEEESKTKGVRGKKAYKDAIIDAFRTNFRKITNIMSEGTDSEGGYLVPDEMDKEITEKLTEENLFRQLASKIETSGDHKLPIEDGAPAASWTEEGGALEFSDATFKQVVLDAHKLTVAIKVTEELLYDSAFNLVEYITRKFAKAIANSEEDAFLNGNGTGKPTGIFDATKGGQIGVTLTSATIKADDITSLVYSLKRPYRKNAKFIMNDKTISLIRKLKDTNGGYYWQPSYQAGEPDRLLGYPVYTSAYCPEIGAGKSFIAFGDFSYYKIGDRGTRSFQELKELYAGNGLVGFVLKERVDGILTVPEAVQIMKVADADSVNNAESDNNQENDG